MNPTSPSRPLVAGLWLAAALVSGCASTAVTDDAIVANTSRALGLERSAFTISQRADSGMQTTYLAKTNAGRTFNCYMEGTVAVWGRVVSDAVCQEMRRSDGPSPARAAPAAQPDPACNALLRAAGRCK